MGPVMSVVDGRAWLRLARSSSTAAWADEKALTDSKQPWKMARALATAPHETGLMVVIVVVVVAVAVAESADAVGAGDGVAIRSWPEA